MVKVKGRSQTGEGRGVYETSRAAMETAVDHIARMEIDNHADTCCFGPNFAIKYLTGVKCSVSTFSKKHDAMEDVATRSRRPTRRTPIRRTVARTFLSLMKVYGLETGWITP